VRPPITFPALGTTATLLVTDEQSVPLAKSMLEAEIHGIDVACSRFRNDSELSSVNANAGRDTRVSSRFIEALEVALRAARLTGGLVDPTVGKAMRVLGYDREFDILDRRGPPIEVALERVPGWQTIEMNPARSTVRVPPGVELDFGATAKALCADRAARAIANATGAGVLVSLGGDVAIDGPAPDGGWPLLIADDHAADPSSDGQCIVVRGGGVATSGTTVRRWWRGVQELHHVIDPVTGRPAREKWRSASVAAGSCVDANIASTAAIVLGARAPAWLEARGLPARLVSPDGSVLRIAGWPAAVKVEC
jgi:thiamine biosynthesis lipoprotein